MAVGAGARPWLPANRPPKGRACASAPRSPFRSRRPARRCSQLRRRLSHLRPRPLLRCRRPLRPPPLLAPPARADLVLVPDLQQQHLPEARQLTTSARLELRVRGQSPADETRTIVTSQRPAAGARVAARSIVFVELGPALLAVPDLRKHPLDEARQILSQAGFELAIMGDPPSNESRANVVEQMPLPGVRAAAGSTVTVRAKASLLTT